MQLSDFDFDLPEELIATRPAVPRSASRLLVSNQGEISDGTMRDILSWVRPGDRLVLNNTKVIPARLFGHRTRQTAQGEMQAKIEVTLLEPRQNGHWGALIKPLKKVHIGEDIVFSERLSARLIDKQDGQAELAFSLSGDDFDAALAEVGRMPLPPYIAAKRAADDQDLVDYQTVFARHTGAVAAPTASLHFDQALLDDLAAMGVTFTQVTLHVGAGTFLPVKVDNIHDHKMHSEWGEVRPDAAAEIRATKAAGGRVIPVGTTALRLVETAARAGEIGAWVGDTDIFIYPGFEFHVADGLITNFHLPKSTLMMLVSALVGKAQVERIYDHAVAGKYRFFSYGDASLLIP